MVDGERVALGPPRHRALLVLLLAEANHVVPSARLIDELWGDDPAPSSANILQGTVSQLRKALGKDAIETRGAGYAVRVESDQLDVNVFERLADAGSEALEEEHFDQAADGQHLAAWAFFLGIWPGKAPNPLAALAGAPRSGPVQCSS
jgi:DNA-binding SARP family transcriptional activator